MDDTFDRLDDIFSNTKQGSYYTEEEIEKARKRMKSKGGTLMENLAEISDKKPPAPRKIDNDFVEALNSFNAELQSDFLTGSLAENKKSSAADSFVESVKTSDSVKKSNHAAVFMGQNALKTDDRISLDSFKGIEEKIKADIYGQDEFIKDLVIAFKRPAVMEAEGNRALNCIYVTGRKFTGRHMTLKAVTKELYDKKLTGTPDMHTVDLSIYSSADAEKLFLQDVYSALYSDSRIILFENFEECHPSFLTQLSDLVTKGSFLLSKRFVMQKGQLISAENALAEKSVGALSAENKYLVFISDKSVDELAGSFGASFVNALGDICETKELSEDALKKISGCEAKELIEKSADKLSFSVKLSNDFTAYMVTRCDKMNGLKSMLDYYDDIYKALAALRLEGHYGDNAKVELEIKEGGIVSTIDGVGCELPGLANVGYKGEIELLKKELDGIVGLSEVKKYIYSLEDYYGVQLRRRKEGLKASEVNKHMIFTGSPGTGKTTIARIVSKYLKAIGVLSGGQLVEVSRADLVGKFVGHTAPLTKQVITSAIGGVLFIDEAYSLYRGKDDTFGLEAIDTLVKGIEDNRDDLVVILAGYSNEMEEFLTANSGLKSRFPNIINFPDYTAEELYEITGILVKGKGYTMEEGCKDKLLPYYAKMQAEMAEEAGNGRMARNLVEAAILNQSKRIASDENSELSVLKPEDFILE
ncbi:MAG: AAA family ATPase [Lachnospiraceae bacterium]|nr:AAA family ATPase [Lachnospiraceae bacterium]